ncbi:hypothetical protein QYE76_012652 [Lolium multiflorum]|uniref:RNase H type-1 domain-containing protein n=1 Tax=Lolium multiflorum TaxID=4521 RepID=A0AAD8U1H7_LOLMU|nr:hypothetical protein QYE76_012652 [Lolium multiflorum]
MASVCSPRRQLAPTVGHEVAHAGVHIRAGLLEIGERTVSALVQSFYSIDFINDNAGCFASGASSQNGRIVEVRATASTSAPSCAPAPLAGAGGTGPAKMALCWSRPGSVEVMMTVWLVQERRLRLKVLVARLRPVGQATAGARCGASGHHPRHRSTLQAAMNFSRHPIARTSIRRGSAVEAQRRRVLESGKDILKAQRELNLTLRVPRELAEHSLNVRKDAKPVRQPLRRFAEDRRKIIGEEVTKLLVAKFIVEVTHTEWLANPVMVEKKKDENLEAKAPKVWRMCIDYTNLNKACPRDPFPLPRIDQVIDSTAGKRGGKTVQRPVYYLSEVLSLSKQNYPHFQKMTYGVFMAATKLKHYFEEHPMKVVSEAPISDIMCNKDASGRIAKWAIQISPYVPVYERRDAIKSQALADFLVDWAEMQYKPPDQKIEYWKMHFDGSKLKEGLGAGVVLTSPKGDHLRYVLQVHFRASNNVAEYEALIHGLKVAKEIGAHRIICYGDSDLVVQQCSGDWDAKDANMASYRFHVQKIAGFFEGCEFHHVPRKMKLRMLCPR